MKKLFYSKVENIELSDKNTKRRLILAVVFGIIAAVSLTYSFSLLFSKESGWQTVESSAKLSCADEFVLQYEFSENSTAEYKKLTSLYSTLTESAYKLFCADTSYENYENPHYISMNPNTDIETDPALYSALELLKDRREIYYAPIYSEYYSLCFSQDDYEAAQFDPHTDAAQKDYIDSLLTFLNNENHIKLEFLGNNRICLHVSEEYLEFAKENGITSFIDFGFMKNAFIADYIASELEKNGYTKGILTSSDGYIRNLSDSYTIYPINDRVKNTVYNAANAEFPGKTNVVCFRDFMLNSLDKNRYYEYANGIIRTPYIGSDGLCHNSISSLILFSNKKSCAELLLEGLDTYICDEFDETILESDRIWCKDFKIHVYGDVNIGQVYSDDVSYTVVK